MTTIKYGKSQRILMDDEIKQQNDFIKAKERRLLSLTDFELVCRLRQHLIKSKSIGKISRSENKVWRDDVLNFNARNRKFHSVVHFDKLISHRPPPERFNQRRLLLFRKLIKNLSNQNREINLLWQNVKSIEAKKKKKTWKPNILTSNLAGNDEQVHKMPNHCATTWSYCEFEGPDNLQLGAYTTFPSLLFRDSFCSVKKKEAEITAIKYNFIHRCKRFVFNFHKIKKIFFFFSPHFVWNQSFLLVKMRCTHANKIA